MPFSCFPMHLTLTLQHRIWETKTSDCWGLTVKCCLLPDEIREMYYTYTVYRRKIIFTSGSYFKEMLGKVSVERLELGKGTVVKDAVAPVKVVAWMRILWDNGYDFWYERINISYRDYQKKWYESNCVQWIHAIFVFNSYMLKTTFSWS